MARDKQDPIQEQLIQARRVQILKAAVAVFAEKGFQKATIRDVAKMAGIADGTIYNYFENKTALMLAILNGMNDTERREDDLSLALHMDIHEFFQAYVRQRYSRMTEEGLEIMRAILPEVMVNPELRDAYMQQIILPTFQMGEKHFAQLVEMGKLRDLDVPLMMRTISATFLGLLMLRILGDPVVAEQWDSLPEILATMTLDGVKPS